MFGILSAAGAILGGGTSILGGLFKSRAGAKMERQAREAIDKYQRQDLQNAFDGVGVSTLGADYQARENARMAATSIDALRSAGTRGLGMVGQVQQNLDMQNQRIAADLDRQQQAINMARAQDDARIRSMQERREEMDLAGLGRQMEAGRQDRFGGLQDISQGLLSMGAIGANGMMGQGQAPGMATPPINPYVAKAETIQPMGLAGMGSLSDITPYYGQ